MKSLKRQTGPLMAVMGAAIVIIGMSFAFFLSEAPKNDKLPGGAMEEKKTAPPAESGEGEASAKSRRPGLALQQAAKKNSENEDLVKSRVPPRKGKRVSLFLGGEKEEAGPFEFNASALRGRKVGVNPDIAMGKIKIEPGDELALELFENASFCASVDSSSKNIRGTLSVGGDLEGLEGGKLYLSCNGGKLAGFVEVPTQGKMYSIGTKNGVAYVFEEDPGKIDEIKDGKTTARHAPGKAVQTTISASPQDAPLPDTPEENDSDDVVTVDLLILCTPAAKDWAAESMWGDEFNIASMAVSRANSALSKSGTKTFLRLLDVVEVPHKESAKGAEDDLLKLTFGEGGLRDAPTLRNKYGADLVCLLEKTDETGGLGWVAKGRASPECGFSLVRVQQAAIGHSLAHECAHNMGADHSKSQKLAPGPGFFAYSAGWQWTAKSGRAYCTIMTYEDHDNNPETGAGGREFFKLGYFSNPSIVFDGAPVGASDADNARTIRNNRSLVAAFRAMVSPPSQK